MSRPPLPPFTEATAHRKVRLAEDAWNERDPAKVALAYSAGSDWRNRAEFLSGREEIVAYIRSVLPIVIQQTKIGGWRGTSAVHFSRMAEWRQEREANKPQPGKGRHGARRRL